MAPSARAPGLVACLLNVSEARRKDVVERVAMAAVYRSRGEPREGATVLNIFNDLDYNRSVITIVAGIDSIREAVLSACEAACGLVDLRGHSGTHPCLGAVDLVPLYPLDPALGPQDCAAEAQAIARGLTERVPGSSAFLFGWADRPLQRGLAQRRRGLGWFSRSPDLSRITPDLGPPPQRRYGLTGVGAGPYVMNCNVTIDTADLALGRRVAAGLRPSAPGGLPGVQVLALPHGGAVEIACNVESVRGPAPPAGRAPGQGRGARPEAWPAFSVGGRSYCHAPPELITARVGALAGREGVGLRGTALVGFTPAQCRALAESALARGLGEAWRERPGGGGGGGGGGLRM